MYSCIYDDVGWKMPPLSCCRNTQARKRHLALPRHGAGDMEAVTPFATQAWKHRMPSPQQ